MLQPSSANGGGDVRKLMVQTNTDELSQNLIREKQYKDKQLVYFLQWDIQSIEIVPLVCDTQSVKYAPPRVFGLGPPWRLVWPLPGVWSEPSLAFGLCPPWHLVWALPGVWPGLSLAFGLSPPWCWA